METKLTIGFAQVPDRPAKALNGPVRASDYPIRYARSSMLAHAEAHLFVQEIDGWQFAIRLYTADFARGQTVRLRLGEGQALVVYQLKGSAHRLFHDGVPCRLEADRCCGCYLPAGDYLFRMPPGKHETLLVAFPYGYLVWLTRQYPHLHRLTAAWKENAGRATCLPTVAVQQDERRTISRLAGCPKRGAELDGALKVYLARLLALYHERLQCPPTRPSAGEVAAAVQAHIETQYASKRVARLADIAKRFGLSSSGLRSAYTARYGTTIAKAVGMQRINAAKDLLRDTDLPLAAIAEQVGFGHLESLIRAFKRATGVTPATYRQQR